MTVKMRISLFLSILVNLTMGNLQIKLDPNPFTRVETTMKNIINSCHKNYKANHPIMLLGHFDNLHSESFPTLQSLSSISFDSFPKTKIAQSSNSKFNSKANTVILQKNSAEQLEESLLSLKDTQWWNHMARFVILERHQDGCSDIIGISNITYKLSIVTAIYICIDPNNRATFLYTFNPLTNYAPDPWKKVESLSTNVYQYSSHTFDISCKSLYYDKTRILNGHKIKALYIQNKPSNQENVNQIQSNGREIITAIDLYLLKSFINVLNATATYEAVSGFTAAVRISKGRADWVVSSMPINVFPEIPSFAPHLVCRAIILRKFAGYMSTLDKIRALWSPEALVAGILSLILFFIVLVVLEHGNTSTAMLDIVRFITCASISREIPKLSFRIYFAVMLIFIVISNGVFESSIASFLTKPQEKKAVNTIKELKEQRYKIYIPRETIFLFDDDWPDNQLIEIPQFNCPDYLQNATNAVCFVVEEVYYTFFTSLPVEVLDEPLKYFFMGARCRRDWPLYERVNQLVLTINQNGLVDYWRRRLYAVPLRRLQYRKMKENSAEYEPVKLDALVFAFQLLAIGLVIATIVFIFEIFNPFFILKRMFYK